MPLLLSLRKVQKIKKQGYPVEIHKIVTQDNYILTTYRIPYGKNVTNKGAKRSPVLLAHGMSGHSDYFLSLGREHALPYYLVDRGFDVCLHALGVYDFPANVDYIVNKTNQKLFVIGHSQGNTCYFIMTSEKPEYNEKIKIGAVYGPSAMLRYIDYPIAVFLSYIVDTIEVSILLLFV
ncbi:hypothetical protein NQ314_017888 [Rhamnusium bicolor]|uniref:Partial AB-hydrolase lipase domain-containing protein n=1 Tax=Rhamnusium bicolor TaxID=1586634 RepID=A0AAV8WRT5_9CUCU|nr:hypothetical protein NQ314_017888 [Rhamnusium bicolor]